MRTVDDRFNSFGSRHVTDGFHGSDLSSDVDHVGDKNDTRPVRNSFFKCGTDLVEVSGRNRNLNQFQFNPLALFPLPHGSQHAWVILSRG